MPKGYQKLEMDDMNSYDHFFKITMLGDSGVGKTCLSGTYTDDFMSTINFDIQFKMVLVDGKKVKFQIWDRPGSNEKAITSGYYRGVHACIIAFDVTNPKSFDNVKKWLEKCPELCGDDVVIYLVGTKCDLESRRGIQYKDAKRFMEKFNSESGNVKISGYMETSAKDGTNVERLFSKVAEALLLKKSPTAAKEVSSNLSKKQQLNILMDNYISKINSFTDAQTGKIDFSRHFWFFASSRAKNREANYELVKNLKEELNAGEKTIAEIFSEENIKMLRSIDPRTDHGINSTDVKNILSFARK